MPKRKVIDAKALIQMIKDEAPKADIMKKFGFKTSQQLNASYLNALIESGEATAIKGAQRSTKPVDTKVTVNGRGSLIIPKALIESFNIEEGKSFEVKKTAAGITLKSV